jgi:predicted regulator of Ras-like GTPase activity (Roadblock/LC7/MglB family)
MAQEYRSEILERILKTLHIAVEGVKASVIVNIDGLLVSSFPPGDEENPHENPTSSPQVAAMAATLIGLAERTLGRLAQGELQRLLMEGEEGVMVVYPAGRASLAVLVEKDARLSHVLYASKKAAAEIEQVLSGN